MTIIEEGRLRLAFGDSWKVLKYDKEGGSYREFIGKLQGTKAVDLLCLRNGAPLVMLELKDYRLDPPSEEKLAQLVQNAAYKVRDTLAGIVGGSHQAVGREKVFFGESLDRLHSPPRVVLFFHEEPPPKQPEKRSANRRDTLTKGLKQKLHWLTKAVWVAGPDDCGELLPDVRVEQL